MEKQVIKGKEAREYLMQGVDILADAVKVTLGPRGKNAVLFDDEGKPYLTKDGVSVAKKVITDNPIYNIGINMIQEVACNTANNAGDGTTTATILAQAITRSGIKAINEGSNPTLLKKGMDLALKDIIAEIKRVSKPIKKDKTLRRIATISSNNDETIGNLVVDAINTAGKHGIIKLENSPSYESFVETKEGFEINRGFISSNFITDGQKIEAEYKDPLLCLVDRDIDKEEEITPILKYALEKKRPIVIIANDFSNRVINIMVANQYAGKVQILPVKTPGFGEGKTALLEDISMLTGAKVWSSKQEFNTDNISFCDRVISDRERTTIIGGKKSLDFQEYVDKLNELKKVTKAPYLEGLVKRIAMLTTGITTVYVGATTELEMREKKDRVEDAICATKAALEEGIVAGGGATWLNLVYTSHRGLDVIEKKGYDIVFSAIRAPFHQLCINADVDEDKILKSLYEFNYNNGGYDFNLMKECNMIKSGIIDPAKVLITAISNAVSIASMIISTECIVYNQE